MYAIAALAAVVFVITALAFATLRRQSTRTLLAVLGVAVASAMLLDMVMLSTGMRSSFRSLLESRGFEIRLAPAGTLPFDTDATIPHASRIRAQLAADPRIAVVSPVLGGQLRVARYAAADSAVGSATAVALGVDPTVQGDYELVAGREPVHDNELVASEVLLSDIGAVVGDTLSAATGYDTQLREFTGQRTLIVVGVARFIYMPAGQRTVALRIGTLQQMGGTAREDRVSLFMLRTRPGTDVEAVRGWIERQMPEVTAVSTAVALEQMDQRLSYFRQLAFILGAISLIVGFLLVTTLVTVSVNERLGEIAVMRAIGVARARVVLQIMLEGLVIMTLGSAGGVMLGLFTARYLNSILSAFPGLPERIDFFLFEPRAAWTSLGLLAIVGVLASAYPAWRGASLPIATTLREEAV